MGDTAGIGHATSDRYGAFVLVIVAADHKVHAVCEIEGLERRTQH
jgi:hypothetical protein